MFGRRRPAAQDDAGATQLAAQLGDVAFFDGFSPDELRRVAQLADDVEAEEGALLIDQGRVGQECFVILDGEAAVEAGGELLVTVGKGSMVGEMALVEHRPRNASVRAVTPMHLLAFDTQAFKTLLDEMPKVRDRVMETLAARLKERT
jgi:CRP/FNR family cyclic AMP-dependent transcriptional regulator